MSKELIWQDEASLREVKAMYGANLTSTEWQMFINIGKATGLNPFLREIWAVKYGNNPAAIFIGRDGYRKSAQTHPDYKGHFSEAVYENDKYSIKNGPNGAEVEHSSDFKNRGALIGAYCCVYRGSSIIYQFVELKEYDTKKSLWATKPATMIKKVAEAQALRMAFQEIFAGTYSDSEDFTDSAITEVSSALKAFDGFLEFKDKIDSIETYEKYLHLKPEIVNWIKEAGDNQQAVRYLAQHIKKLQEYEKTSSTVTSDTGEVSAKD